MKHFRKAVLTVASCALTVGISAGLQATPVHADRVSDEKPVYLYRLYNPNSGEHFYTSQKNEQQHLASVGWNAEGIGWIGEQGNGKPVYRLYNANGGEHHYTLSTKERDHLKSVGWRDEGIGWYSYVNDGSPISKQAEPVYREYNPNKFSCNHNYTTSKEEHDYLISLGWKNEGIAWYAKFINELDDANGFSFDNNTKTISWNPVKYATGYAVTVSKNTGGGYQPVLFKETLTPSLKLQPEQSYDGTPGKYRVEINAQDDYVKGNDGKITKDFSMYHYLAGNYNQEQYLYFDIR